jgi:hypothetical protein
MTLSFFRKNKSRDINRGLGGISELFFIALASCSDPAPPPLVKASSV